MEDKVFSLAQGSQVALHYFRFTCVGDTRLDLRRFFDIDDLRKRYRVLRRRFPRHIVLRILRALVVRVTHFFGDEDSPTAFWFESNGIQWGPYKVLYPDGSLSESCTYRNGRKEGTSAAWDVTGRPTLKCKYKDGKLHGLFEQWDARRNCHVRVYKNGVVEREWFEYALLLPIQPVD